MFSFYSTAVYFKANTLISTDETIKIMRLGYAQYYYDFKISRLYTIRKTLF